MDRSGWRTAVIGVDEATTSLARIIGDLETNPSRAYEIVDDDEHAVVLVNRASFERLVQVAEESLEVDEATRALADEPLARLAEYHTRRLARRTAGNH